MPAALLSRWEESIPVVGMVHLRPLPGSPRFDGNLQAVVTAALRDAEALAQVEDAVERGGADAVIVSGSGTGKEIDSAELRAVRSAARAPVWVGSGVTPETIGELSSLADGFIVGSSLKANGSVDGPVDARRVRDLIAALR